ncbi:hypothetical protein SLEP1_g55551 [Rubroshorea leprosula]|uniref:PGG domain-containing protein n=1 Tax=Rubroshorea leprosula TaxID=152421 RepID=A0AAV5MG32_9ROSI|nr:hypothetical protein SLEP1_g55551 [Rubroshorea leprosula]
MVPNLVQPVPYTNATASLNVIIPEVLKEDNYKRWSILMRHYFVAQDLWDVVLSSQIPWSEDPGDWTKKNALALLAIKMSCGAETFDQIEEMDSARDAWNALADLHKPPNVDGHRGSETDAAGLISSANWIQPGTRKDTYHLWWHVSNGEMKIAKCLVQKNDKLLTIRNKEGYIPLVVACFNRRKPMSSYLCSITPFEFLLPENSNQGTLFLKFCVLNFMLGLGNVKLPSLSEGTDSRHKVFITQTAWVKVIDRILEVVIIPTTLCAGARLKHMYELKLSHLYAESVLRYWCQEISTYRDATQLVESGTISAIFQAIKDGPIEIVIKILKANPDLIWCNRKLSRDILSAAIKYRRGRILGFVYRLDAGKKAFLSLGDEDGNNTLHLLAKLPECRQYNNLRPIEIMVQETKWLREVRLALPEGYTTAKNLYGETPVQVFDREHQKLIKEAEEWIKKTADSYILIPVLIVTIMFAALFTVPGGNNQETGIPILLHRKLFSGFLICDAVSLLTGSTSMLAFLVLLTSSNYPLAVRSLHLMLAIPLLIISIITMILAFIFALTIMLQRTWVAATLIFLLILPIYILVNSSYFIIADAYKWTFRSVIF